MEHITTDESKFKTLYELFFKYRNVFTDIGTLLLSVIALGLMANINIPLWPVPITFQTFGVFLIAFFFGARKGTLSIFLYLITGLLGVAVFAKHASGYLYFLGPTAGYLIGFIPMVFVVGLLVEKGFGRNWKSVLTCMFISEIILYICGLVWLQIYLKTSLIQTLQYGLIPFMLGDILKILLALPLFPFLFRKGSIN